MNGAQDANSVLDRSTTPRWTAVRVGRWASAAVWSLWLAFGVALMIWSVIDSYVVSVGDALFALLFVLAYTLAFALLATGLVWTVVLVAAIATRVRRRRRTDARQPFT